MFTSTPEGVLVITDTLATTMDGADSHTVTKCFVVPHLELVIAGTGLANLAAAWRGKVCDEMLCRDIDMLAPLATAALTQLWQDLQNEHELPSSMSSTIYHFGRSTSGDYAGYAFRSTDGFAAERLGYGFGVKPPPVGNFASPESIEEMVALAERIREEQRQMPLGERIYIGAQLVMTNLYDGAISQATIHTFDDFEIQWLEMNDRMRSL
jgi:hypothetical protein